MTFSRADATSRQAISAFSVELHLKDGRTDGRTDKLSVRPSYRWSLALTF